MKTSNHFLKITILFSICFFLCGKTSYSQIEGIPNCGTIFNAPLVEGPYKPTKSTGNTEAFKILIVHICFADDNNPTLFGNFVLAPKKWTHS